MKYGSDGLSSKGTGVANINNFLVFDKQITISTTANIVFCMESKRTSLTRGKGWSGVLSSY